MFEVPFSFSGLSIQAFNMIVTIGIAVFVFAYMIGRLLFISPFLDMRLEEIRENYNLSSTTDLKKNLSNKFWIKNKDNKNKKTNLRQRLLELMLNNALFSQENLKINFEQAGWVPKDTQFLFLASKFACFLLGLGVGYVVIITRTTFADGNFITKWLVLILTAFSGWLVPDLYLRGIIKNRVKIIEKQFPNALDLIIICLQAGLGLNRAIERVSKEIAMFGKEIAHELMITNIELEIMLDRRQALQNLYMRVPSAIIRNFTTTVLQSIQQGTPTLQALDNLSKEVRDTRMQNLETKAAKLPSLMVIPLVLFVMPNLFILLLGPAIVRLLNAT